MLLDSVCGSIGLAYVYTPTTRLSARQNDKDLTTGKANATEIVSFKERSGEILKYNACALIAGRLSAGKRLSAAEKRYLRENDPETYRKATMLEAERKMYRRRLEKARTKDEVRRLNMSVSAHMASETGAVNYNPGGSLTATASQLEMTSMRASAIRDEHGAFVNTREYRKLPENAYEMKRMKRKTAKMSAINTSASQQINIAIFSHGADGRYKKRGISYMV